MKRLLLPCLVLLLLIMPSVGDAQAEYTPITLENLTQLVQVSRAGNGGVRQMAFSPDQARLALATTLGVWVTDLSGSASQRLLEGQNGAWSTAYSPDGSWVAGGGDDGSVMVWDAHTGAALARLENHLYPVSALAWTPEGKLIASGDWSGVVRVWDTTAWREYRVFEAAEQVARLNFAGAWLVGISQHSVTTWEILRSIFISQTEHEADLGNPAEIVAGERSARWDAAAGVVEIWDNGEQTAALDGFAGALGGVSFAANGQAEASPPEATDEAPQPVISPNGAIEAAYGNDGSIQLLDAASGEQIAALYGHIRKVNAVAFSLDGTLLVSASDDGTLQLWDATTQEDSGSLVTLRGHSSGVTGVAFNAAGTLIASSGYDGTVRLWGVPA